MPTKAEIKNIAGLRQKKLRDEQGLFVVEGEKVVREAIEANWEIVGLYSTSEWSSSGKTAEIISSTDMERMTSLSSPSPCLAVIKQRKQILPLRIDGHWIVLDSLSDPGNVGTIIRTAEWFGLEGVFCSGDCVELYNPKLIQSTMGSIFRQRIVYGSREEISERAKEQGLRIIVASMNGTSTKDFVFQSRDIILIGNESHGVSEEFLQLADRVVTIPGKGNAESLNASVAAAILMSNL
jgi:RNA methyltransferase, TrmH family